MKIAKKVQSVKIEKTLNFTSQKVPAIVPKLNRDNVSSVTRLDEVNEPKEVFVELNKIRHNYLEMLETLGEDDKLYLDTIIMNILTIESKMIALIKRRVYEKVYSRNSSRDVDKIIARIDKLAREVDTLIREMFLSEQIWNPKLYILTKKQKKTILMNAEDNRNEINKVSFGVTAKWEAYSIVYNKMKRAQKVVDLKGKKHLTLETLKELVKKHEQINEQADDDSISAS